MISDSTIDKIFETSRIDEVVGDFIDLNKSGSNLKGNCPFHSEKTASFIVSPSKNIASCFGCDKKGLNPVSFIIEIKNFSYPEALRYLAAKYNILVEEDKKVDPEQKKLLDLKESIYQLNTFAAKFFHQQFLKSKNAVQYAGQRVSKQMISHFGLGFAQDKYDAFFQAATKSGYSKEQLITSKLVKQNKEGQYYDYFRNRLIFPIINNRGRITGFSGRALPPSDEKFAKYINSPDTLVYKKSNEFFGANFAVPAARRENTLYIVEGNFDVVSMHQHGFENTVAACGTSLTKYQADFILKYARDAILLYDGDDAGRKAANKNGDLLVKTGLNVYLITLPDGEDPDTFIKDKSSNWINKNKRDFILYRSESLFSGTERDPLKRNDALSEICHLIASLDKTKRNLYVEQLAKLHSFKPKLITDKINELSPTKAEEPEESKPKIPDEVDPNEFEKWGFYEYKNQYWFRTNKGTQRLSNFIMKPLFHTNSNDDSRRIFELLNVFGKRVVVGLDMQEMTSLQAFKRNIEGRGNFIFWGMDQHLTMLKLKWYEKTRTCQEIKVLGWQKEGFFAWANGCNNGNDFIPIDEYGIVSIKDNFFYLPPLSKIFIDDKSLFIAERKFRYDTREITLYEWSELMLKVFEGNAILGISFWVAAIFRDFILNIFRNFPILNLFGPKGTGKSQMAISLCSLFGESQTPFNIHNGTKAGLAEHVQQFSNSFAWIDEYKNALDYDKIETLKSIYDAIGRNRMNMDKGRRKETTQVNSGVILSGQEMPTADVALFSRVIFLRFHKDTYTDDEKSNYDRLKTVERYGLSHLTSHLLKHREYFEKNYYANYDKVISDLTTDKTEEIEDRILRSMAIILAAFKTILEKVKFSFTYDTLFAHAMHALKIQNSQIQSSNEIGAFWDMFEAMSDNDQVEYGWHFKIDHSTQFKHSKGEMHWQQPKAILKFKFTTISKLYRENARKSGNSYLPNDSLRYYLENSKHFLGVSSSAKFSRKKYTTDGLENQTQVTTAYCFDYINLNINLLKETDVSLSTDAENSTKSSKPEPDFQTNIISNISTNDLLPL